MSNIQHGQREPGSVFAAAAPLIVTLVGVGREELLNEISVSAMNLHAVEACQDGATYRFAKFGDHAFNFRSAHRYRRCGTFARRGNRAWRNRCASAD
ncbi:hypothetical protein EDP2_3903 [Enterobacter cloacae S611]|uniref:Uncharacterized protein n=1 Tax=Enterobacter cloacae S611 TaxID=1399146 RepID=A0ABN0QCU5_ENTCL|nr:hypothetical protein EDP2_3903 [Enterobacter cloacae S611]